MLKQKVVKSYNWLLENLEGDSWKFDPAGIEKKETYKHMKRVNNYLVEKLIKLEDLDEEKVEINNGKYTGAYEPEYTSYISVDGEEKYTLRFKQHKMHQNSWKLIIMIDAEREGIDRGYLLDTHYPKRNFEKVIDNLKFFFEKPNMSVNFNNHKPKKRTPIEELMEVEKAERKEILQFVVGYTIEGETELNKEIILSLYNHIDKYIDNEAYIEHFFEVIEDITLFPADFLLEESKNKKNKRGVA